MSNKEFINQIINALGNPHFNADQVIEALKKAHDETVASGGHPGSIDAISNILPDIDREAKNRYLK